MSNALAIAGVTAVIQSLLTGVYSSLGSVLGGVSVSAVAPDIVQTTLGTGSKTPLQLNVFLHQVSLNQAWRNQCLPSLAPDGITQLNSPPLALDLHYLLTAYGGADTEAEALLGYAILLLHTNPVLGRTQIKAALAAVPAMTNPLNNVLSSSGLAEQIEMIKITPDSLGREEIAWVWTAIKADYRPTFAFQASVVLIDPQLPTSSGPPVLSRTVSAQAQPSSQFGLAWVQLLALQLPPGEVAPVQGETVTISGTGLGTVTGIVLSNVRQMVQYPAFAPGSVAGDSITFKIPIDAAGLPAGSYNVSMNYKDSTGAPQTTNSIPMGIAPVVSGTPTVVSNAAGILVTLNCTPNVQQFQSAYFALNANSVAAQPFTAPASTLSFQFPPLPAGSYLTRLQVDGVNSQLVISATNPPVLQGPSLTVP